MPTGRGRKGRSIPHSKPSSATGGTAADVAGERNLLKKAAKLLGPGFITGASDDDPSGIGTYAVAGASLGLQTLWTALLTFPLMSAVQNICARIGMVSGQGLAGVLREHYPRAILYGSVLLLFGANTINVGADLGAIADAVHSITGVQALWLIIPVAAGVIALQIFGSYRLIANTFKWLTLALFAYVVDVFIVHPDLLATLRATIVPTFSLDPTYVTTIVAILGTTISPYLFFWQSSEEVEEEVEIGRKTRSARRGASKTELDYSAIDVNIGMGFSNLVMYFIILATAITLFKAGKTDIKSAADAAQALKPLVGDFAGILFAVGMIGAGLLAIPILSCSAAYAIAEAFGWEYGLDTDWTRAKPFYAVIVIATALGVAMNYLGINPIDALFYTAVINGIVAPPLLVVVMRAARNPKVMGKQTIGPVLTTLGWLATIGMFLALAGLGYTTLFAAK
ncbi:MAG TPA: divalent metal cation transporter [Candidatus Limnocylindria bacterium]|jgi:NRAMP (natural resistance-associated macrophage protein)-like metal ion transporter